MVKFYLLIYFLLAISCFSVGQNVGINNTDPQTALDIRGKLRIRPNGFEVTSTSVTLPNVAEGYFSLNGSPSADFMVTLPSGVKGTFLLIENTTSRVATLGTLGQIPSGKSKLFLYGDAGWILAHDSEPSQLEKITEGGNSGWRLLGRNPNHHGDIGTDAVDLSFAANSSLPYGATGSRSFAANSHVRASGLSSAAFNSSTLASGVSSTSFGFVSNASGDQSVSMGNFTNASSFSSLAIGMYNDTIAGSSRTMWNMTDPLFTVGNGTSDMDRRNAFLVRKNGNTSVSGTLDALADATMHTNLLIKDNITVQDDALVEGSSTTVGKANVHGQLTVGYNGVGKSTIETDKSFGAGFLTISSDLTLNEDHHTIRVGPGLSTNPTITLPAPGSAKFRIYYIVNHSDKDVPVKPGFVNSNGVIPVVDPTNVAQYSAVTLQSDGNYWYRIQ